MTMNDGGIIHISSFCNGLWNTKQAAILHHRIIIRRSPMEVALHIRVSTTRQQQHQTIAQQLSRLRAYGARTPIGIWPTSTSTGMTAIVALHSSAPVLTDSEIG